MTSRLVKYAGLRGALLALPLVALGGYAIVAAGVGFSVVRWVKTAENATDYSIMNTARQLLWLPTTREEKYKAKQAIDTFFVRAGDLLSAGAVFFGTTMLHLTINQFALGNIVLTMVWIGVALMILTPRVTMPRFVFRPLAPAVVVLLVLIFLGLGSTVAAEDTGIAPYGPGSSTGPGQGCQIAQTTARSTEIDAPSNLPPGTGVFISVEVSAVGAAVPLLGRAR